MIGFLIVIGCGIVGAIVGFVIGWSEWKEFDDGIASSGPGAVIGILCGFAILLFYVVITNAEPIKEEKEIVENRKITSSINYSLRPLKGLETNKYYLGMTEYEGFIVYYYATEIESGIKTNRIVDHKSLVIIKEQDYNEYPEIIFNMDENNEIVSILFEIKKGTLYGRYLSNDD